MYADDEFEKTEGEPVVRVDQEAEGVPGGCVQVLSAGATDSAPVKAMESVHQHLLPRYKLAHPRCNKWAV